MVLIQPPNLTMEHPHQYTRRHLEFTWYLENGSPCHRMGDRSSSIPFISYIPSNVTVVTSSSERHYVISRLLFSMYHDGNATSSGLYRIALRDLVRILPYCVHCDSQEQVRVAGPSLHGI